MGREGGRKGARERGSEGAREGVGGWEGGRGEDSKADCLVYALELFGEVEIVAVVPYEPAEERLHRAVRLKRYNW